MCERKPLGTFCNNVMWKTLRITLLLLGMIAILTREANSSGLGSNAEATILGIAFLSGLAFALLSGWTSFLSKRRFPYLIRPSIATSPFDQRVVLQFQHFASTFFILLSATAFLRSWREPSTEAAALGFLFGIGLLTGTLLLMRVFQARFQTTVKPHQGAVLAETYNTM